MTEPVTIAALEFGIWRAIRELRSARILLYRAGQVFWPWKRNKLMSEASDAINGVTSTLNAVANEFPAAISSALSTAAAGGAVDPALAPAVTALQAAATNMVSVLQGSLPQVGVTSSLAGSSTSQTSVSASV